MVVFLLTLLAVVMAVSSTVGLAMRYQGSGTLGDHEISCDATRFCLVVSIDPDTPMQRAGVRAGDLIRFDHSLDFIRPAAAGETQGFTLRRGTSERHMSVTATQRPWTASDQAAAVYGLPLDIAGVAITLLAMFLAVRSRGKPSTLLLATALACNYMIFYEPMWLNGRDIFGPLQFLANCAQLPALLIFAAFARQFRRESTGGDGRLVLLAFYGLAVLTAAYVIYYEGLVFGIWYPDTMFASIRTGYVALLFASFVLSIIVLLLGRRDVAREQRSRFTLLMTAVILTAAIRPLGYLGGLLDPDFTHTVTVVFEAIMMVCAIAGAFLFAYAILRHRVIDIGFAVNQTLIYGAVSFVVLLLFGLAEWGIEKLLPKSVVEGYASAGIALVIFLLFHRIRDFIEHLIEGVFFHKWRQNEAQLASFINKAGHILKPDALKAAAVAEFTRFSGGAEVALYRAERTGFVRDAGTIASLGATVDTDLAPLVEMRAEGKPLFDTDAAPLHAALVLPMIQRNDLMGFVVLGYKPSGDAWRPDERAALSDAASKIGLDLHALRIEELESEARQQRQRADILEAQVQQGLRGGQPA
ncbi:MAG: hypothetical protein WDN06_06365 [Asticcacaulis sp.]